LPVTVIIRSAAQPARADALKRAVESVVTQANADVTCSVIFNGRACDPHLVRWARRQPRTRCTTLYSGGKREATIAGRQLVQTPFFCYLDDDDELMPGALSHCLAFMEENPLLDCVATNGYHCRAGIDDTLFPVTRRFVKGELLESLVEARNWLASGAAMFRTDTVAPSYFQNLPKHREWTVIAFRLATDRNVLFSDMPTCRIHSSPQSESKTDTYAEAALEAWRQISICNQRAELVRKIKVQQALALRSLCSYYRLKRRFGDAWAAYLRALASPAGWSYLPYAALLLARTTRPAAEIVPKLGVRVPAIGHAPGPHITGRLLRRASKYTSRAFWRMVYREAAFRGRAARLYTLPSLARTLGRKRQTAFVFPLPMDHFQFAETYVAWKVLAACDLRIAARAGSDARVALAWHPATQYDLGDQAFASLEPHVRVLNRRCTNITKSHVGECFSRTFGYALEVDPLTYCGTILRKSERNGAHDAVLLDGPLTEVHTGYVYQRFIRYETPKGEAEWRVFIVGARAVGVYSLYAPRDDRFDYTREIAEMTTIDASFTHTEQERMAAFCAEIGLDFGVLDVLRDASSGLIYISDCNNTPTGPSPTLTTREQVRLVRDLARHFKRAYLSEEPR
jgi:hypothetical protein